MKMIKRFTFCIFLFGASMLSVCAYSYSSYYGGATGQDISWNWWTGWNINGDYTEAVAANRPGHSAYMKRAYARMGSEGSYSEWKRSGDHEARVKDYGPFGSPEYEARGYWDYD